MTSVLSKLLVSQKGVQDRKTPQSVYLELNKEFNFQLDPCTSSSKNNNLMTPFYFTKEQDGLIQDWSIFKSIFINPPFKDMKKWVKKILYEIKNSKDMTIVLLAPAKTETEWFHLLLNSGFLKEVRFQRGRVTFEEHKDPFIIGIVYFILKSSAESKDTSEVKNEIN